MIKIHILLIMCLSIILLTGCAPSASAVATAIAKTQSAWTPTPLSTLTQTPMSTFTPSPTSHPTPVPVVLYSEDFSNNQSGWLQANSNGVKYQYSGGQYVIDRSKGNLMSWTCANRYFTDAVLTVDTLHVLGDAAQTGIAVIWRYVDNNNFYVLQLNGMNHLLIGKLINGKLQTLDDEPYNPAINSGQQINKIAISFKGGISAIYINGLFVKNIQDSAFTAGDICLGAFSSTTSAVEVSFDNLVIDTVGSWTPPG